MLIQVTQKHIDSGEKCEANRCAIANAINDVLDGDYHASVIPRSVDIWSYVPFKLHKTLKFPQETVEFIRRFDVGLETQPFEFELDIPSQFLKPNMVSVSNE